MSVECRKLGETDLPLLQALLRLYDVVFEMDDFLMPDDAYLLSLLVLERTLFFVAVDEESVVGGLTAHVLPSTYGRYDQVYVYDLAVGVERQRQGIGRQLIAAARAYAGRSGAREVFLQAEADDQRAVAFYRAIGGSELDATHFSYAAE